MQSLTTQRPKQRQAAETSRSARLAALETASPTARSHDDSKIQAGAALPSPQTGAGVRTWDFPRQQSAHTSMIFQALLALALVLSLVAFARQATEADAGTSVDDPPPAVIVQTD